ncbi:MAG: hypothetical protein Kow0037_24950 [Calditrichia bacterium]
MGYDTRMLQSPEEIPQSESVVFVTRSPRHARELKLCPHVLLKSDKTSEQLLELDEKYQLRRHAIPLSRCSLCNHLVVPADREDLTEKVPERILAFHQEFFKCPKCGKIYWKGGHIDRMLDKLERMGLTGIDL